MLVGDQGQHCCMMGRMDDIKWRSTKPGADNTPQQNCALSPLLQGRPQKGRHLRYDAFCCRCAATPTSGAAPGHIAVALAAVAVGGSSIAASAFPAVPPAPHDRWAGRHCPAFVCVEHGRNPPPHIPARLQARAAGMASWR